jgi:hypothetical protein
MIQVDAGENFFDLDSFVITHRSEWESKLDPSWTSYLGVDAQYGDATVNLRLPSTPDAGGVNNPFSSGETFEIGVNQKAISVGPYWRNTINTEGSPWTLMPSLRVDYFSQTKELLPQPRLATRYQVDSSLFYRAAAGLYFQPPEPQETSVGFGNPDVNSPYSIHYTMGFEKDFRDGSTDGFNLQTNLFYRQFDRLVIDSQNRVLRNGVLESERFNNDGEGRSYGIETFLKYGSGPVSGWLVYTLSRSFRSQPGVGEFPFQFDQTHNVNLVGSYDAGNNWRFSTRLRYVTGNPITPVSGGVFDANNDVYFPVRGPFFSERLNSFFQLDFRIDKTWVYDSWTLNFYFDIQNVTNRENIEGIRYSYNFAERRNVMGLPLFPIFGFRGDF